MNLFRIKQAVPIHNKLSLDFETPIGTLDYFAKINHRYLEKDFSCYYLPISHAAISCWKNEHFLLEVLKVDVKPKLPKGMSVDKCRAVLWRMQSFENDLVVAFETKWRKVPPNLQGSPDTGEGLEAQSWDDEHITLMIGSEDADFIGGRASCNEWLPKRFEYLQYCGDDELCFYLDDGMRITFPPINKDEVIQAQFVTAYVGKGDNISPWFAVDMDYSEILDAVGCV